MEYSLQHLNKVGTLKDLTLDTFVETLNLIGLEVDDIILETSTNKISLNDIKLDLKIPANREDLLNENILLKELAVIFLFEIYETWELLKERYFFILKQKYLEYEEYSISPILSKIQGVLTYGIKINKFENINPPIWLQKKLSVTNNDKLTIIEALIKLTIKEWGQNFNTLDPNLKSLKIEHLDKQNLVHFANETYFLKKGSIVLKDDKDKIVSILGIINSKLENKNVLIEASFYNINKNTLDLNDVDTKVSFRYLRRSFLMHFKQAFQRLLTLIEIVAYGEIDLKIFKNKSRSLEINSSRLLKLDKNSFKKILNIDNYNLNIFERSNLKIVCTTLKNLYFQIPDSRTDLIREIDLIEEYARFIGYKNFKEILPVVSQQTKVNSKTEKIAFIKQFFLNYNFNEVFTNSLVGESKITNTAVSLKNPLNSDLSLLRESLIPNLLEIYPKNLRFGIDYLKFFEIGRIYKQKNENLQEEEHLAIAFPVKTDKNNTEKLDFFSAKGFIEQFLRRFENEKFIFEKTIIESPYYHPNKYLTIYSKNEVIGNFGEIHPKYKKLFNLKQNIYLFELNLDLINIKNLKSSIKIYKDYSKYPVITKDLSLIVEKDINFYDLKNFIWTHLNTLKNVKFFDIYFEPNLNQKINLGVRLEFQSFNKTLLTEEIEESIQNLTNKLTKEFGCQLKI